MAGARARRRYGGADTLKVRFRFRSVRYVSGSGSVRATHYWPCKGSDISDPLNFRTTISGAPCHTAGMLIRRGYLHEITEQLNTTSRPAECSWTKLTRHITTASIRTQTNTIGVRGTIRVYLLTYAYLSSHGTTEVPATVTTERVDKGAVFDFACTV
jgi:hypothetical protein